MTTTSLNRLAISPSMPSASSRQAHGEVAAAQRTERADELAAIDKVTLGLYVHSTLRVGFTPPAQVYDPQPPGCADPYYRSKNPFRFVKYYCLQSSARPTQASREIRRLEIWRRACLPHFLGAVHTSGLLVPSEVTPGSMKGPSPTNASFPPKADTRAPQLAPWLRNAVCMLGRHTAPCQHRPERG